MVLVTFCAVTRVASSNLLCGQIKGDDPMVANQFHAKMARLIGVRAPSATTPRYLEQRMRAHCPANGHRFTCSYAYCKVLAMERAHQGGEILRGANFGRCNLCTTPDATCPENSQQPVPCSVRMSGSANLFCPVNDVLFGQSM